VVTAAIARELAGFVWAIARQAQPIGAWCIDIRWTRTRGVASHQNTSKAEQGWRHGHGQENPRFHYQPDLIRRWLLDRGSSATHHRSGGNQPAHQSMINRRLMIVPPAVPSGGHVEQLGRQAM